MSIVSNCVVTPIHLFVGAVNLARSLVFNAGFTSQLCMNAVFGSIATMIHLSVKQVSLAQSLV